MSKLLKQVQQQEVSQQWRLPTNNSNADSITSVTGETVQFYYYNSGTLTIDAGQAAGTVVVAKLTNNNVMNSLGDGIGSNNDTSFAFTTGTILTTRVAFPYAVAAQYSDQSGTTRAAAITNGFSNGEYCIDHESGTIYGVKATTGTSDTGAYKILGSVSSSGGPAADVNVSKWGGTATTLGQKAMAASVPVTVASDQTKISVGEQNVIVPFAYDYIELSYTGANLTGVVYKTGGSSGSTVATLTLAYTGSVLDSVTRS